MFVTSGVKITPNNGSYMTSGEQEFLNPVSAGFCRVCLRHKSLLTFCMVQRLLSKK